MLTDTDLRRIANNYELHLNGVVTKDELPILKNGWYIVNMQSSRDGNGTHWCALLYDGADSVWFDSFGFPPPFEILAEVAHANEPEEYIHHNKIQKAIRYFNNMQIQDINDDNCGLFCIAIICFFKSLDGDNKKKLRAFQNLFSSNTLINTTILKKFLRDYKEAYVLDED